MVRSVEIGSFDVALNSVIFTPTKRIKKMMTSACVEKWGNGINDGKN